MAALAPSTKGRWRIVHLAFVEPHLKRYGGIRRVLELSNALVAQGHEVTIHLPSWERQGCDWMRCDARVAPLRDRHEEPYDLVLFNNEPQWYVLDRFVGARARGIYALHFGRLYDKEGSWECLRVPVDLRLANSTWTADMVEAEIGHRPTVLLGGVNAEHFRPVDVPKRYPLLTMGGDRAWKGTDDVRAAARRLGLPLETYDGKDLPQGEMAAEYAAAEVFVVGSHFEGFGQPGLEALACGTPLVTTDNGGCRDYAIDEETALVVPPRAPQALADAIARLRGDAELQQRLRRNGLDLVAERFSWPLAATRLVTIVEGTLAGLDKGTAADRHASPDPGTGTGASTTSAPVATAPTGGPRTWTALRPVEQEPVLSVVVLTWDNLTLSQRCLDSLRANTDVTYELVVVDNGSAFETADYVRQAADVAVLFDHNTGFAAGMNHGLAAARGRAVCFLNNDTVVPPGWSSRLLESLDADPVAGIVVPALTAAGNDRTVRSAPGDVVERLLPFEAPPSAVCVVMPTDLVRSFGGWDESYAVASGEDLELAFVTWVNGREIVVDERVLVDHVGHATSDVKLPDRLALWATNRQQFLDRWSDPATPVTRLADVSEEHFAARRRTAAVVADWMGRYFRARDRAADATAAARSRGDGAPAERVVRATWSRLRALVPESVRLRLWPHVRGVYYRYFPDRHPRALRGEARRQDRR